VTDFYWLILGILAVWRVSYFLASETGPWEVMERVRLRLGNGFARELVTCLYCVSVWVAAPFAYITGATWKQRVILWPALSAGAIIVERCIHREKAEVAAYIEDRGVQESTEDYVGAESRGDYQEKNKENEYVLRQR
jgi:hypothetical protein